MTLALPTVSPRTLKCAFIGVNVLFTSLGVLVLYIGVQTHFVANYLFHDYDNMNRIANTLIGTGVIVVILGVLGFCGVAMKDRFVLIVYALFLILILVIELLITIYAFTERSRIQTIFVSHLVNGTRLHYGKNDTTTSKLLTKEIDWFQENVMCCGANGPRDWRESHWYSEVSKTTNETVPLSCCIHKKVGCNVIEDTSYEEENIFTRGCVEEGRSFALRKLHFIGGLTAGGAVLEVLGTMIALCLCTALQAEKQRDYIKVNSH